MAVRPGSADGHLRRRDQGDHRVPRPRPGGGARRPERRRPQRPGRPQPGHRRARGVPAEGRAAASSATHERPLVGLVRPDHRRRRPQRRRPRRPGRPRRRRATSGCTPAAATRRSPRASQVPGRFGRYDVVAGGGDLSHDGRADLLVRERATGDRLRAARPAVTGPSAAGSGRSPASPARRAVAVGQVPGRRRPTSSRSTAAGRGLGQPRRRSTSARPIDTRADLSGADKILVAGDWDRDGYGDVVTRQTRTATSCSGAATGTATSPARRCWPRGSARSAS